LVKKNAAPTSSAPICPHRFPHRKSLRRANAQGHHQRRRHDYRWRVPDLAKYWIRNDNINYDAVNRRSNELADNDGMRIRKAELRFAMMYRPTFRPC